MEVLDLRTVWPMDKESILKTVEKTSRAVVLYESHKAFGIGAEVSAVIAEEGFPLLDAPIIRIAPPNVPHKFTNNGPGRSKLVCIHASPTMVTEWFE